MFGRQGKWHQGLESIACVPVSRGFGGGSLGYLGGAEDHADQTVDAVCNCTGPGTGCVDLWRDLAPARGENGTYSARMYTDEAVRIIAAHPKDKPLFLYQAWHNVHGPYEVPTRYRAMFPPDASCDAPGGTRSAP